MIHQFIYLTFVEIVLIDCAFRVVDRLNKFQH